MKRHLQRFHKIIYDSLIDSGDHSQTKMDKFISKQSRILELCADIAFAGRPFSLFHSPSMKKLLDFAILGANDPEQTISSVKVRQAIVDRAKEMRKSISRQLQNQMLNVSGVFASLHGNEFRGKSIKIEMISKITMNLFQLLWFNLKCRKSFNLQSGMPSCLGTSHSSEYKTMVQRYPSRV